MRARACVRVCETAMSVFFSMRVRKIARSDYLLPHICLYVRPSVRIEDSRFIQIR